MTRDRQEGVCPDGYVTTGADAASIAAPYDAIVDDAVSRLASTLGGDLHSVYLYGSVATGQARPPASDVDLYVVTVGESTERCRRIAGDLTDAYGDLVRGVGIADVLLDDVRAPGPSGQAVRCFLRHYCVLLHGYDLRAGIPRCRPTKELARGFNGDVIDVADRAIQRLDGSLGNAERVRLIAYACRRLLMAAATLCSVERGGWSTDRATGADLIATAHPDLAQTAARALRWADATNGIPAPDNVVRDTLRDLAAVVAALSRRT